MAGTIFTILVIIISIYQSVKEQKKKGQNSNNRPRNVRPVNADTADGPDVVPTDYIPTATSRRATTAIPDARPTRPAAAKPTTISQNKRVKTTVVTAQQAQKVIRKAASATSTKPYPAPKASVRIADEGGQVLKDEHEEGNVEMSKRMTVEDMKKAVIMSTILNRVEY